ncbi:hypothetical protein cce_0722 [Crocosphaera subtropica ATCC 51142]|uniref:Ribbon-helix-helix protein CopG domain-containing protein n=1 Tax=Crocosphaera subtropica (strain ATCC 51142 / BH68) TaxID=43989 RepID=B1WR15_CROS5|nr:hypothetical protein [Crocosphaera subtropica]ACB50073.1 hypothetical protein cce_0722 [Crocosphaera subtropica ATCC 51142]
MILEGKDKMIERESNTMDSIISFRILDKDKTKLMDILDQKNITLSKLMRNLIRKEIANYFVVKNSNQV